MPMPPVSQGHAAAGEDVNLSVSGRLTAAGMLAFRDALRRQLPRAHSRRNETPSLPASWAGRWMRSTFSC